MGQAVFALLLLSDCKYVSSPLLSSLCPFSGTLLKQSPLATLSLPGPSVAKGCSPMYTDGDPAEVAASWE